MPTTANLDMDEVLNALEPLIRRIVREELQAVAQNAPNGFTLHPEMPLHQDLQEILQRKTRGQIGLHTPIMDE